MNVRPMEPTDIVTFTNAKQRGVTGEGPATMSDALLAAMQPRQAGLPFGFGRTGGADR